MADEFEIIEHDGELLALIVRDDYSKPGTTSALHLSQRWKVAYTRHQAGKIKPDVDDAIPNSVAYKTLFIKRGLMRVDFLDEEKGYLESREFAAGDVILLVTGGHRLEVLEEVEMVEVKHGGVKASHSRHRPSSEGV